METIQQPIQITKSQYDHLLMILNESDDYVLRPDGKHYAVTANLREIMVHCLEETIIDESKRYWNRSECIFHIEREKDGAIGIGTAEHLQQIIDAFS